MGTSLVILWEPEQSGNFCAFSLQLTPVIKPEERNDLPVTQLKIMTINILTEVMRAIHKQNENFNERNITSTEKESELKNTISELKSSVEGFSDRLDQTG